MNGKKAKKLRQKSREYSVGIPEVKYNLTRKHLINYPALPKPVMCGTVVMDENCTRAIYKKLKIGK